MPDNSPDISRIAVYPVLSEVALDLRQVLHPLFKNLRDGISEFTFANIYLFREVHNYRVSMLDGRVLITGSDGGSPFFTCPFGLPDKNDLTALFERFTSMKCVSATQREELLKLGCKVEEDRINFDYLYGREDMRSLTGRRFHRKKNLVNFFTGSYNYEGRPLTDEYIKDALNILEEWKKAHERPGDYEAAREALLLSDELQLCGGIYFVDGAPAAYALGEELREDMFVVHFEKGVPGYKGLLQFVNQSFASILPERYSFINREQDLGDEGLRKSKESYQPMDFVRKYRATR